MRYTTCDQTWVTQSGTDSVFYQLLISATEETLSVFGGHTASRARQLDIYRGLYGQYLKHTPGTTLLVETMREIDMCAILDILAHAIQHGYLVSWEIDWRLSEQSNLPVMDIAE